MKNIQHYIDAVDAFVEKTKANAPEYAKGHESAYALGVLITYHADLLLWAEQLVETAPKDDYVARRVRETLDRYDG